MFPTSYTLFGCAPFAVWSVDVLNAGFEASILNSPAKVINRFITNIIFDDVFIY